MAEVFLNSVEPPEWLNKNFIQTALRDGLRLDNLTVNHVSIRPATNVGDNYLSQMFRVTVNIDGENDWSLIIKSMPRGEEAQKHVNESNCFTRETEMLLNTLPVMQKILNEVGEQKICAELYYQQGRPNSLFILEDLCLEGYKTPNRLDCLDLAHSILVAESLAVFHASSLVAIQKNPKIKETFANNCWQAHNDKVVTRYTQDGITTVLECLESWKTLPPIYAEKMEKLRQTGNEKLYRTTIISENEINVLNHCDPWTSNLMFQYDNQKPINCLFVDFQFSCYNSLVLDLLFFVFSSTKNELRINCIDDILEAYHCKLVATCKKLNYPLNLSLDNLKEAFFRRLFYGFYIQLTLLPFMIVPSKDVKSLNEILTSTESKKNSMIDNAFYKEAIETTFPFFLEHGIFD